MKPIRRCRACGAYTEDDVHCGSPTELLLDGRRRERLSKLMSGLLRHFPEAAGLRPDLEGFIGIDELVEAIRERWKRREFYAWVAREHIEAIAKLDPKGRFELRGDEIRATYGHTTRVEVKYLEDREVRILYHGTSEGALPGIMTDGILRMRRKWVHLTSSFRDAIEVGRRKGGRTVVLEVDAEKLRRRGITVYKAGKNVYVVERVPPDCIRRVIRP